MLNLTEKITSELQHFIPCVRSEIEANRKSVRQLHTHKCLQKSYSWQQRKDPVRDDVMRET